MEYEIKKLFSTDDESEMVNRFCDCDIRVRCSMNIKLVRDLFANRWAS